MDLYYLFIENNKKYINNTSIFTISLLYYNYNTLL